MKNEKIVSVYGKSGNRKIGDNRKSGDKSRLCFMVGEKTFYANIID